MIPAHPILDAQWMEFRALADAREVLPGGIDDWSRALWAWRALDPEMKEKALCDVAVRDTESPECRSLPQNYLEKKRFTRPLPRKVEKKTSLERLFE